MDRDKVLIQTSVYFAVLGCLLDYLIDYGSGIQKAEARRKLSWEYCSEYFFSESMAREESAIDLLYEKVSVGMHKVFLYNEKRYQFILRLVQLAIRAEQVVNHDNQKFIKKNYVLNKSVLFIRIAVEILLCNKNRIESADREAINALGEMFALIDDLYDFYEDIKIGQMNLLMMYVQEMNSAERACMVIEDKVLEVKEKLKILKRRFDEELYEFVLQEIKEWGMSNREIQCRIWGV